MAGVFCFGGAGLEVARWAEYEGDGLPRASTSPKTRLHGRYGGTDVSGHAEGDRSGGYLQLLCPVKPSVYRSLRETPVGTNTQLFPSVDESSVPCEPDPGVTRLCDGPCCASLKVQQETKPPTGARADFRPFQPEPLRPKERNPGGCGCPVEERAPFGGGLAVIRIPWIVPATYCTWAVWWTTRVGLSRSGSSLTSPFLKPPSRSVGSG